MDYLPDTNPRYYTQRKREFSVIATRVKPTIGFTIVKNKRSRKYNR